MVIIVWRLSLGHYNFATAVDAPFAGIEVHFPSNGYVTTFESYHLFKWLNIFSKKSSYSIANELLKLKWNEQYFTEISYPL